MMRANSVGVSRGRYSTRERVLDPCDGCVVEVGVDEFGTDEPGCFGDERVPVEVLHQQGNGRGARLDCFPEPADPLVGNAEIRHFGGDCARAGTHGQTCDPADGSTEDESEQARPQGPRQRRAGWRGIDRFVYDCLSEVVLDHRDCVFELQFTSGGEAARGDITLRFEYRTGGSYGVSMLYKPPFPEIVLTRSGNLAYGDINLSVTTETPNNSFTEDLTGRIDLGCDEC